MRRLKFSEWDASSISNWAVNASMALSHFFQGKLPHRSYQVFSTLLTSQSNLALVDRITPSFTLLFRHFFTVAFYSIWVMFTHPRPRKIDGTDKPVVVAPGFDEYPYLTVKAFQVVSFFSFVLLRLRPFSALSFQFLQSMLTPVLFLISSGRRVLCSDP